MNKTCWVLHGWTCPELEFIGVFSTRYSLVNWVMSAPDALFSPQKDAPPLAIWNELRGAQVLMDNPQQEEPTGEVVVFDGSTGEYILMD